MTKLTKKEKLLIIISLVIIIAIGSAFAHLYNEKNNWHNVAAEYNRNQWSEIHSISLRMKERGFTQESIAEMYPYINAKIFSAMSGMYPSFDGKSPYYSVLGTYYVSLAQDIWLNKDWTDEKMQKAIDLFEDTFISVYLSEGEHTISLSFFPEGFIPGIIISLICVAIYILIELSMRRTPKK